jgi:hypothetical protein
VLGGRPSRIGRRAPSVLAPSPHGLRLGRPHVDLP